MRLVSVLLLSIILPLFTVSQSTPPSKSLICSSCEGFAGVLKGALTQVTPGQETEQTLVAMCTTYFSFLPFMEAQCRTCVTNDLDTLRTALMHNATVNQICADILKLC